MLGRCCLPSQIGWVSTEEIFEEIPYQDARHGTTRFAAYVRDTAFKPGRESKSHSESHEPQESCDDGSGSAFAKPRELVKAVNGLKLLDG